MKCLELRLPNLLPSQFVSNIQNLACVVIHHVLVFWLALSSYFGSRSTYARRLYDCCLFLRFLFFFFGRIMYAHIILLTGWTVKKDIATDSQLHREMFLPTDQPSSPPRKLNRSGQQLKRNAACLPCRRRRIKCDAGRPHCSSCEKSYNFLKKTQPDDEKDDGGIRCWYDTEVDEQPVISVKRKKIDDGNENDPKDEMIKELEAKVGRSGRPFPRSSYANGIVIKPNYRKPWVRLELSRQGRAELLIVIAMGSVSRARVWEY